MAPDRKARVVGGEGAVNNSSCLSEITDLSIGAALNMSIGIRFEHWATPAPPAMAEWMSRVLELRVLEKQQ